MKVIVAGGRDYKPTSEAKEWLISKLKELKTTAIVCGCAKGADTFGKNVAIELGIEVLYFPPMWEEFGKSAGYKRNVQMAEIADHVILFPGGKGTEHMKNIAMDRKIPITLYE